MKERQLLDMLGFEKQKWLLLYKASEHGFAASKFHQHCDGRCNTLTLVKTRGQNIFGGFTGAVWSSSGGFATDPYARVFSLGKDAYVAKCIVPERAIYCEEFLGPTFGENDIKIVDESNKSRTNLAELNCYQRKLHEHQMKNDNSKLLACSYYFKVSDIEKSFARTTRNWPK